MPFTDWFSLCEKGVHDKLKTLTKIKQEKSQMSYGDDSIFAQGYKFFVRTKPGSYSSRKASTSQIEYIWVVVLEIYAKHDTSLEKTWMNFREFRSDCDNVLQHDNTLGHTLGVQEVSVDTESEPQYVNFVEGDKSVPIFLMQTLQVSVRQRVNRERM